MNLTIDISTAINENTGIGRYTSNLVKNLIKYEDINFQLFAVFFRNSLDKNEKMDEFKSKNVNLKRIILPGKAREFIWSNKFIDPIKLIYPKTDVYFAPTFISVPSRTKNTVVTIYDVVFDIYPDVVSKGYKEYFHSLTKRALDNASEVIAISESTKKDLLKYYQVDEEKIKVIYLGVEDKFFLKKTLENKEEIRKKFHLPKTFTLFVGTISPRKNLKRIFEAYDKISPEFRKKNPLVVVGEKGWLVEETIEKSKDLIRDKSVIFTGRVTDEELITLYQASSLFIFPSLYEGFGLPILESMAGGTPVLTSNTSSLKEIAGDAALTVNPESTSEIKDGIIKILTDKKLAKKLSDRGLGQAKKFSWESCTKKTLEIYRKVYGKN